ncbi:MAG: HPr family phosphocarrier protein [Planctomycetota bacterium]
MTTPLVRTVTVVNPEGVHLRPADQLVRLASQFESNILIGKNSEMVDAKSILSLMTLGAEQGCDLQIEVEGSDAELAIAKVADLISSGFPPEDSDAEPSADGSVDAVSQDGSV